MLCPMLFNTPFSYSIFQYQKHLTLDRSPFLKLNLLSQVGLASVQCDNVCSVMLVVYIFVLLLFIVIFTLYLSLT